MYYFEAITHKNSNSNYAMFSTAAGFLGYSRKGNLKKETLRSLKY